MVSWYDLAPAGRSRYLDWLHGSYIPKLLRRPGILTAAHYEVDQSEKPLPHLRRTRDGSLPQGGSHIFILAARDAHVFADLTAFRHKPNAAERKTLALRVGERVNIFTEEHRAQGPDAKRREGRHTLARCPARTRRDECRHRLLVRRLLLRPAGEQPGLAHMLQQRPLHTLGVRLAQPEHRLPGRPRCIRYYRVAYRLEVPRSLPQDLVHSLAPG